jgi:glycerophosphoryl diester phosphodiesterase
MLRPAHDFDVQGHRGARGLLPENTMPAFTRADDLGVTTLEMDTKVTKDGVLVVTHDSTLNPDLVRDASGQWVREGIPLNSLTLAEVKQLDVGRLRPGSDYAKRFPEQQAIDGTRMPALRGLAVVPWTVNDPAAIAAVTALGVDGIISDYPKRALDATPQNLPRWIPITLLAAGVVALILAVLWGGSRAL